MNELDVMLEEFGWVTLERIRDDGRVDHFTVRNVDEFLAYQDAKIHRHRVFSPAGELLFERTPDGEVVLGTAGQKAYWNRKRKIAQKAGISAMQIFADSSRRAMRYWFGRR